MSLLRRFRRQIAKRSRSIFQQKRPAPTRRPRRVLLEPLEPRILLSADFSIAMGDSANDLKLLFDNADGDEKLVVLDNTDQSVVDSELLSNITGVEIFGTEFDDSLTVDFGFSGMLEKFPILFSDASGTDSDLLTILGGDRTWNITGPDTGRSDLLAFAGIENLSGGPDNQDTFQFQEGGNLSGEVEGGDNGFDTVALEGAYDTVGYQVTGADSGILTRDGVALFFTGMEPIADNTSAVDRIIGLSDIDDIDAILAAGNSGFLDLSGSTFEGITFANPTGSLTILGLDGDDTISIESIDPGFNADLTIEAETILFSSTATLRTDGNVTFTALAENHVTGSTGPAAVGIGAVIHVDGIIDVGGALTLSAAVNNAVDLDASDASISVQSVSNATVRIGSTAIVNAATLDVSAVTNTDISVDITDASSGGIGLGAGVVDADRGSLSLLRDSGPADFYLWDSTGLDLDANTYVVTHGWRDGLPYLDSWMDMLNSIETYDPGANVIFTDWNELSENLIYPEAADDTYEVGGLLADFLKDFQFDPLTTTLIGHSLGGQVSGIAADRYRDGTGNSIARVIALDPAGPFFEPTLGFAEKPLDERLDAADAARVVALHTTTILGYDEPLADLDLYVNSDSPVQPGETNFAGNHSYAVTLLAELLQGESFSQTPGNLVGDDLDAADLFNVSLLGSADVASYASPVEITTLAGIEGGAQIVVGTTPISATEPASVRVQAVDTSNIHSSITTGPLSDLTAYDFVQGKIGLARDTRAYIGGADLSTTLSGPAGAAAGIVNVSAQNLGNVTGEVFSDFLEYKSSSFARENLLAYVENSDLDVEGLDVSAKSASDYAVSAEENSNTVRGFAEAYIDGSTVTAGAAGVSLSAANESSFSALSHGDGGRMSLNDIRNDVGAHVTDSVIDVADGAIGIAADNRTVLDAVSTLSASNPVFAAADVFAINVANGDVDAYAENTVLTTTGSGDISIEAANEATINAKVTADATADSGAVIPTPALTLGAGMAFNAVGWDMANVLWATIEDFVGDLGAEWLEGIIPFAESTPANARAYLLNSAVTAAGDLILRADSAPQINATVSNAAESTASSLFGTFGGSAAGVLASNKISSTARAFIDHNEYDYEKEDVDQDLKPGERILLTADGQNGLAGDIYEYAGDVDLRPEDLEATDFSDSALWEQIVYPAGVGTVQADGSLTVTAEDNAGIYSNVKLVSSSIVTNDGGVHLLDDAMGYLTPSDDTAEDSTDEQWVFLGFGHRVRLAGTYDNGGNPGSVYEYMGTGDTLDINSVDYSDLDFWKEVTETQLLPEGVNLTSSPSITLGGLVVFNEVRTDVAAHIDHSVVTADAVEVKALENAVIHATADSTAESSGGSAFGTGLSLAVNGTLATNVVLSAANAYITESNVTTTGGDLVVGAKNTSELDAKTLSATMSGESSVGVVLAFNTIGWETQNLLFNSLDALLGLSETAYDYTENDNPDGLFEGDRVQVDTGEIYEYLGPERTGLVDLSSSVEGYGDATQWREVTPAFGNESPAQTQAYIIDTDLNVFGDLSVTAQSAAQLTATVSNETTSMVTAFFGASAMSASGVLASNKVSTLAKAYIDYTGSQGTVHAGGKVTVSAKDTASIDAVSGMGTTAKRTNDLGAGLLDELVNDLKGDYQYTTKSDIQQVEFGDKVRVASDYTLPTGAVDPDQETAGKVFQYMGTEDLVVFGYEDYSDYELWKELKDTNVVPKTVTHAALKAFNLDTGTGKSFYGLVVRNDVQSVVESFIDNAAVDAGATVAVTAEEGAQITTDDHSIVSANSQAAGGVITTNQVQSGANAFISGSSVATTAGDVEVDAQNVSALDATATTQSRATKTVGVVVALNTIGWDASNILFQAIDALLGDDLLTDERPAQTAAYILDSTVTAADNVSVTADSTAQLNATVGNEQVSSVANDFAITSKLGWSGMSAGGTLASNKVSSTAEAYIENTGDRHTVTAGGTLTVEARDDAGIDANTQVVNSSISSNTLSAVTDILSLALPDEYQYTTASGEVEFGLEYAFDEDPDTHLILPGDGVRVGAGYNPAKGDSGSVYKFVGVLDVGEKIDLGTEDYTNEGRWYKLTGGATDVADWYPNFGNLTDSDARAFGMLVVVNDVRSDVDATIDNTTVSAGEVSVTALENASIQARAESNVTASGGSFYGSGTVIAANGNIVTNLVQSEADAYITNSDVTVTDTGTTGDLTVAARNTSGIDATVLTTADSGDTGVGVTLAFNTLGWKSQNVLFNTVDAIIGSPEIAHAFGLENPSFARAYIEDTTVDAAGDLSVTAANEARLNATVSNAANSAASALWGASGKAIGGAVAMNKVNSGAQAYIDNAGIAGPDVNVSAAGTLAVSAQDNAQIYSNVKIVSSSITTNDGGVGVIAETARDYVPADYSTAEGSRAIEFGERVRLADDYSGGGNAGSVYEYMGPGATIDLGAEDYSDMGYWKEVVETQLFPEGVNITESDSLAIGGLVALNEIRSEVAAYIEQGIVDAGSVTVQALENAVIHATADSTAESSGGSFATGQGQSLAVNGTIATNVVLSAADAYINKSTVNTTAGDVALEAKNTSTVDAKTLSSLHNSSLTDTTRK